MLLTLFGWIDSLGQDVRFAFRMMRRTPVFTAAVMLTIALAIGANTVIFSVVDAVMLRPLPFREPQRVLQIAEKNDKLKLANFGSSVLNFLSWREQSRTFDEIAAVGFANYTLSGVGEPEQLSGSRISPALTRVLGIAPVAGRTFTDEEEKPGSGAVAMLGEGVWKRRFASDPGLIGRTLILNGTPTTIVGIAPASLSLISGADVYTPLTINPAKEIRLNHVIVVFGRLKNGVSIERAQAEMNAISSRLGEQYPEVRDWSIRLITMFDTFVSPQLKTGLLVLLCAVGLVLLIACANIANLLLARAAARQKEISVRTALGARRARLVSQLLVESVALSVSGGAAGLLLAAWAMPLINRLLPPNVLPVASITIDTTVLWFASALTVLTGLIFGVAPAWRASRTDLNEVLKQGGRGGSGRLRAGFRNALAAVELALATILLIGAGLLIQSLTNLQHVRLGFEPRGVMTFQLAPPTGKYPLDSKAPLLYRSLLESLRSIPGVSGAAVSSGIPFGNGNYTTHPMLTTGPSALPPDTLVPVDWRIVSPGYFKAMNIPLVRGRDFTDADTAASLPVTIISEGTAKAFWGDEDPIGRTLTRSADRTKAFTVIGVVGDVRSTALNQQSPSLYYPTGFRVWPLMDVVVRTSASPDALLPVIRQKVHELDADLALANVRPMEDWVSNSAAQPRLNTVLLGVFASVAVLIAAIGIYGVLAYAVSQRTREIGLRIALGASRRRVVGLVVAQGMSVGVIGIVAGIGGGLLLARTLSSLVYGVAVHDPITYAAVAVVLVQVALAACVVPAVRAASVDPMVVLRDE